MTQLIIFCAKYLYLVIILIAICVVIFLSVDNKRQLFKFSLLAFPLSFLVAKILNYFIYNVRPFVVEHIQPLIDHAADNGFPSDHTLLSATIASVIFVYSRKLGILLFCLTLIMGIARVLAKVHHPIDVFGSMAIAIFMSLISWLLLKRYSTESPTL